MLSDLVPRGSLFEDYPDFFNSKSVYRFISKLRTYWWVQTLFHTTSHTF